MNESAGGNSRDTTIAFVQAIAFAKSGRNHDNGELINSFRHYLLEIACQEWRNNAQRKLGASDIVQITIIKANQKFEGFRGRTPAELAAWLRAILLRVIYTEQRRIRTRKADARREVPVDSVGIADKAKSARQQLLAAETKQLVRDAIAKLPAHYQEVIALHQHDGLNFAQIAIRIEKSEEAARKLWERAVARVKIELKKTLSSGVVKPPAK